MTTFFAIRTANADTPVVTINADTISFITQGGPTAGSASSKNMTIHFNNGEAGGEYLIFRTQVDGDGTRLVEILSEFLFKLPQFRERYLEYGDIEITSVGKDTP